MRRTSSLVGFILSLLVVGCGTQKLVEVARAEQNADEAQSREYLDSQEVQADPLTLRNIHIQQYEDRMPRDDGQRGPTYVTIFRFDLDVCERDVYDGDFSVEANLKGKVAGALVKVKRKLGKCARPRVQTFNASSSAFAPSLAVTLENPLAIERLGSPE